MNPVSDMSVTNPDSLRVKMWREQNRERYNQTMRNYQKRRRLERKVAAQVPAAGIPDAVLGGDGGGEKAGGTG